MSPISFRSLIPVFLASLLFAGCQTPAQNAKKKKAQQEKEDAVYKIRDDKNDVSFQSFIGRLRKAVARHDVQEIATLMAPDFGYSWADGVQGYGCFKYWTDNNLWPELEAVVSQDFVPNGTYLVAPPAFAEMGEDYGGYRAGICRINGSFKFAYFVPPKDADAPPPPQPGN